VYLCNQAVDLSQYNTQNNFKRYYVYYVELTSIEPILIMENLWKTELTRKEAAEKAGRYLANIGFENRRKNHQIFYD
jgi:hypothetical protein